MKSLIASVFSLCGLAGLFGQSADLTVKFQHEIVTEMRMYENDALQGSFDYRFLTNNEAGEIGMIGEMDFQGQQINSKAIYNSKEGHMLMLIDQAGMKMGMSMKLDPAQYAEDNDMGDIQVKKTGRSKEIMGYQCDEYEITSESAFIVVWITPELDLPEFYNALGATDPGNNQFQDIPEGFMMEMKMWPKGKDSKESMELEVTEINLNQPHEISSTGYQIMEMPNR